jgi:hypothetical protein
MSETIASPRRQRGIATKLSPEEQSRHFAELGRRSGERRVVLSGDQVQRLTSDSLSEVSVVIREIAQRVKNGGDA